MQDFTKGRIGRQIISFSIPIILGNLFMQLYQIIDSVIVGQFVGVEALAAVGASSPVIFAVIALVIGIGSGASVVISQYYGARDYESVRKASDSLHIFLLGSGVLVALLGYFFSETMLRFIDLPENIMPEATQFLQIFLGGIIFMFGFNYITSLLRGVGDSKTPLYFLIGSALLNIVLDLVFVIQFGWGVAGAAWASVISMAAAYFSAIVYVNRQNTFLKINLIKLKFDPVIFRQSVRYGLPTGIQQSFVGLGAVALMSIVNRFGTEVIAGYSIGMRVENLTVIPAMNFGMALQSFVAQNIGADRLDRVKKAFRLTLLYSTITCIVITILIVIFRDAILSIFTDDAKVIAVGREYLVIACSFYVVFSTMFTINGLLRGAGAVVIPMVTTIISLWAIRIPAAWLFSSAIGETGIWWSIPFGWCFGCALAFVYYRTGKWKNKSVFAKR